jgi:hypothetical protein
MWSSERSRRMRLSAATVGANAVARMLESSRRHSVRERRRSVDIG